MIDSELPTTKNLFLYITQSLNFSRNKKLIKKFIHSHPKIYSCEYYPEGKLQEHTLSFLGLHFNPKRFNNHIIKMVYHSMHNFNKEFIKKQLKTGRDRFKNKFIVAYGTIAKGIQGNEPILQYSQLEEDLEIAKDIGIKEVIIFRLGGLNKRYVSLLRKYSSP